MSITNSGKRFFITRKPGPGHFVNAEQIECTDLVAAIANEERAWREDRGVFSVELMLANGKVIEEARKIFDFIGDEKEGANDQ